MGGVHWREGKRGQHPSVLDEGVPPFPSWWENMYKEAPLSWF